MFRFIGLMLFFRLITPFRNSRPLLDKTSAYLDALRSGSGSVRAQFNTAENAGTAKNRVHPPDADLAHI